MCCSFKWYGGANLHRLVHPLDGPVELDHRIVGSDLIERRIMFEEDALAAVDIFVADRRKQARTVEKVIEDVAEAVAGCLRADAVARGEDEVPPSRAEGSMTCGLERGEMNEKACKDQAGEAGAPDADLDLFREFHLSPDCTFTGGYNIRAVDWRGQVYFAWGGSRDEAIHRAAEVIRGVLRRG